MNRRLLVLVVIALAGTAFLALGGWSFVNDADRVEELFTERGALGPVVFVLAMWALQPAGVPGALFMVPAAVIWPLPTAIALSWIGNMGASTIAFAMARWFAHEWAQARLPARLRRWDSRLAGGTALRMTWQVTLLRLITGQLTPADWLLGLSTVSVRAFVVGTGIGIIPGIVLFTTLGGGLFDLLSNRVARWVGFGVLIGIGGIWRARRWQQARAVSRDLASSSGGDVRP